MKHVIKRFKKSRPLQLSALLVLLLALPLVIVLSQRKQQSSGYAAGNTITFTPSIIPLTDPEIVNPFRGLFKWINQSQTMPNWPMLDAFDRFSWRELEPTQGNYDFSKIDTLLAYAKSLGGKAGFRIISACSGGCSGGIQVPDYLAALMPLGFWFTYPGQSSQMYAPDWNDPDYIARADALLQAISSKYANDPRLGFIDASLYGDWSEWHVFQWPYNPSPTGATKITSANGHHLIDTMLMDFPKQYLLMQHQTMFSDTADTDGLLYALGKSARVGIRNDCLGNQWFTDRMSSLYSTYPIIRDRWQTAPLGTEYCYQSPGSGGLTMASGQISTYHVGMISNSNFAPWTSYSSSEQTQIMNNNKNAGYRFALTSLTMPATLAAGGTFSVTGNWSNSGVTPAYNPWNVMMQLRDSSSHIVWQGQSSLGLTVPFSTTSPSSKTVIDSFTLPSGIADGTYTVAMQILDANSYYQPLALANTGRLTDGSYPLGVITVGTTQTTLTPAPTNIPTPTGTQTTNLLQNPSFESGIPPWFLNVNHGAGTLTQDTTTAAPGGGAASALMNVTQSLGDIYDIGTIQQGISLTTGQQYTVSFWAKADTAGRQVLASIDQAYSPYSSYASQSLTLTTNWQQYSFTYTQSVTDNNTELQLDSGQSTGKVWLDSLSLTNAATIPTNTPAPTSLPTPTNTPTPTPISDTTPPSVTITNPLNGSTVRRNSTVTITASASDNVGVTQVVFTTSNGASCTDTTTPYTCAWSVPGKPRATYTITAKAYDAAGNTGTSTVTVTAQ